MSDNVERTSDVILDELGACRVWLKSHKQDYEDAKHKASHGRMRDRPLHKEFVKKYERERDNERALVDELKSKQQRLF